MRIVGVTGNKRSGKDELVKFYLKHYSHIDQAISVMAFADPIYEMIETVFAANLTTTDSGDYDKNAIVYPTGKTLRFLLQTLGTEWGRVLVNDDLWVDLAEERMKQCKEEGYDLLFFTDVRFNNEAALISRYGGTIVRVVRPSMEDDRHASEKGIDPSYVDRIVYNTGTLEEYHNALHGLFAHSSLDLSTVPF